MASRRGRGDNIFENISGATGDFLDCQSDSEDEDISKKYDGSDIDDSNELLLSKTSVPMTHQNSVSTMADLTRRGRVGNIFQKISGAADVFLDCTSDSEDKEISKKYDNSDFDDSNKLLLSKTSSKRKGCRAASKTKRNLAYRVLSHSVPATTASASSTIFAVSDSSDEITESQPAYYENTEPEYDDVMDYMDAESPSSSPVKKIFRLPLLHHFTAT